MKDVSIYDGEARIGSFLIAKGLDRDHKSILQTINDYEEDFLDFGVLKTNKLSSTGGRSAKEKLLNEDHFLFLGTLLRNSKKVVVFKKSIILQFKKCRIELNSLREHKEDHAYKEIRHAGKIVRKQTTDVIKNFVEYSTEQGSKKPETYYINITKMLNSLLFIVEGRHKNLREMLTTQQLMTISSAEQIVERALSIGMSKGVFYKKIYKDVRKKVELFAELHGQSEVISEELEITND